MDTLKLFSRNMRLFRKALGFTQEALAEKSGLHRTYIGGIEQGRINPSLKSVERVADALNVDIALLFLKNPSAAVRVVAGSSAEAASGDVSAGDLGRLRGDAGLHVEGVANGTGITRGVHGDANNTDSPNGHIDGGASDMRSESVADSTDDTRGNDNASYLRGANGVGLVDGSRSVGGVTRKAHGSGKARNSGDGSEGSSHAAIGECAILVKDAGGLTLIPLANGDIILAAHVVNSLLEQGYSGDALISAHESALSKMAACLNA